jgi:hypothetical protein
MNYLISFIATVTVTTIISVAVGDAVLDYVDAKLQPLIESLEVSRPLPSQSSEPLLPKPVPEYI